MISNHPVQYSMRPFYYVLLFLNGFLLFACNSKAQKKLAIIGSSTPACFRVVSFDSCYVNRVQRYYSDAGTPINVDNKAEAGDNIYRGMPTGYTPPAGRDAPEPARNITAVLAGNPDVVLVHYPSNGYDVFSISEAMFCMRTIKKVANDAGKPCFFGTTQPRTSGAYNTPEIKKKMIDLRDSILNAFGAYAINFWDRLVNPADTALLPQYDFGDSTHLTSAGHSVVAEQVIAKNVFAFGVLPLRFTGFSAYASSNQAHIQWTTVSEEDIRSYNVERSDDGSSFHTIQQIPARHQSSNNYSVTDPTPVSTQSYYRIAAISNAGQPSYTQLVRIATKELAFQLQKILVNGLSVSAELHAAEKQEITIQLVNNTGQVLAKISKELQAGFNRIQLPASLPGNGLYFLRIVNSRLESQVKSFVK
ncbi:MAG: T9SS type A sorting domain-containing protein [Williamsia sp.]|nr:T9SS type A sorting domain-containing protein [Williamsia sp.]